MNARTLLLLLCGGAWLPALAAEPACEARAGTTAPVVVELYTSEGCSSCPPADRWLSTLKGRADVLALAFHVDYWDRLGWADRFASAEATRRQYMLAQTFGSDTVYTPQVLANGQDWRGWRASTPLPAPEGGAPPALALARDGQRVTARIGADGASRRLGGYWAVVEDGHVSRVGAGENRGETLRHDHVVRLYRPVAEWQAREPRRWVLDVLPGDATHPRRVAFVVVDARTQRPLQAVQLGC